VTALNWLVNITSSCYFFNWFIIAFTSWRFHQALKAQNDRLFSEIYAWQSTKWPLAPAWLSIVSTLIFAGCWQASIIPLGAVRASASNFFQYMLGILIILFFSLVYKLAMRTHWRDPKTADLVTGRRTLGMDEIKQLDEYYQMPKWRRFLTYAQLW
jgi:yeast amino acid transporter